MRIRPRTTPGGDPYTRKTDHLRGRNGSDRGSRSRQVKDIGADAAPFKVEYDPSNPAADARGFVKMPNVNMMTEMADMREANLSYTANLEVIKQSRQLYTMTVDLLRNSPA